MERDILGATLLAILLTCGMTHLAAVLVMGMRRTHAAHSLRALASNMKQVAASIAVRRGELDAVVAEKAAKTKRLVWLEREKAARMRDGFRFLHRLGAPSPDTRTFAFQVTLTFAAHRLGEVLRGVRGSAEIWENLNFVETHAPDAVSAGRLMDFAFPQKLFARVALDEPVEAAA